MTKNSYAVRSELVAKILKPFRHSLNEALRIMDRSVDADRVEVIEKTPGTEPAESDGSLRRPSQTPPAFGHQPHSNKSTPNGLNPNNKVKGPEFSGAGERSPEVITRTPNGFPKQTADFNLGESEGTDPVTQEQHDQNRKSRLRIVTQAPESDVWVRPEEKSGEGHHRNRIRKSELPDTPQQQSPVSNTSQPENTVSRLVSHAGKPEDIVSRSARQAGKPMDKSDKDQGDRKAISFPSRSDALSDLEGGRPVVSTDTPDRTRPIPAKSGSSVIPIKKVVDTAKPGGDSEPSGQPLSVQSDQTEHGDFLSDSDYQGNNTDPLDSPTPSEGYHRQPVEKSKQTDTKDAVSLETVRTLRNERRTENRTDKNIDPLIGRKTELESMDNGSTPIADHDLKNQAASRPMNGPTPTPPVRAVPLSGEAQRISKRVASGIEPVLEQAYTVTNQTLKPIPDSEAESPDSEPMGHVNNTFNVNVSLSTDNELSPGRQVNLEEALAEVLRNAARRQGLDV